MKMSYSFVISARIIVVLILGDLSCSRLMKKPENEGSWEVKRNYAMNCSSYIGSNSITWYFILFDTTNNVTVAVGRDVVQEYINLFQIDQPNPIDSNLIIFVPSNLTAGTYTCSDGTEAVSAQFSVMTVNFEETNNLSSSSKYGDVFSCTLSASFYGNDFMIPQFYVMLNFPIIAFNITNPEITKEGSLRIATGTAIFPVTCGQQFPWGQFNTFFSEPRGNVPSNFATNAPTSDSWGTGIHSSVYVTCTPSDAKIVISGLYAENVLYYGQTISCSVPSSTPVNYTWSDFTYGNTSKGQQLTAWHNGTYQCNASTEQGGIIYSASKLINNLIVLPGKSLFLSVYPLFGPIAGGTRLTFSYNNWPNQILNVLAVYIGDTLEAKIVNIESKRFIAISPIAKEDIIQRPLQITIECTPGPFNLTTDLYFSYRSNPEIIALYPDSFIVSGGTSVNVTGSSLSSISDPMIQVTVAATRVNATENVLNTTTDICNVVNSEGTEMVCRMPPVNLPNDFLDILNSDHQSNGTSNIVKTNSSVMEVLGSNGKDRASVYLGFILDGYKKYNNISNALPGTQVSFYSSPEIISSQKICELYPNTYSLFLIQGSRLTLGCRLTDYVVHVGNVVCENIDIQDNVLTVRLPNVEPKWAQNDAIICENYLNVRITIGYKEYHYCCLKYKSSYTVVIIAVCVGVGGFLLLLFTTIGVVCCCCRKYRIDRGGNNSGSSRQQSSKTVDRFYKETKDDSKTGSGYLQTIELERPDSVST